MAIAILTREERVRMIAETPNQIERIGDRFYRVTSQSGNGTYIVTKARMNRTIGWVCECPDHVHRQVKCRPDLQACDYWAIFALNPSNDLFSVTNLLFTTM